jgi:hypothetical protein
MSAADPKSWRLAMSVHGPEFWRVRAVMSALAFCIEDCEDHDGEEPTIERVASSCRMSVRTVRKHLRLAESEGWLIIDATCDPEEYRLKLPDEIAGQVFHMRKGHERRLPDGRIIDVEFAIVGRRAMTL